jgi:hypothetical protein
LFKYKAEEVMGVELLNPVTVVAEEAVVLVLI